MIQGTPFGETIDSSFFSGRFVSRLRQLGFSPDTATRNVVIDFRQMAEMAHRCHELEVSSQCVRAWFESNRSSETGNIGTMMRPRPVTKNVSWAEQSKNSGVLPGFGLTNGVPLAVMASFATRREPVALRQE